MAKKKTRIRSAVIHSLVFCFNQRFDWLQVDCFSFGMFKYELLTLRQPFEGHESVKEFILEGGRPSITPRVRST